MELEREGWGGRDGVGEAGRGIELEREGEGGRDRVGQAGRGERDRVGEEGRGGKGSFWEGREENARGGERGERGTLERREGGRGDVGDRGRVTGRRRKAGLGWEGEEEGGWRRDWEQGRDEEEGKQKEGEEGGAHGKEEEGKGATKSWKQRQTCKGQRNDSLAQCAKGKQALQTRKKAQSKGDAMRKGKG